MFSKTMKIALAAFLHDIGKFAQRSHGDKAKPGDRAFYPSQEFLDSHRALYQPYNSVTKRYTHEHAIYTAAFIDHLEALLPDCFNDSDWGGKSWIAELAAGHHLLKKEEGGLQPAMRWSIAIADRLASSLDRAVAKEFEKSYNLQEEIINFRCARQWPIMEAIKIHSESDSSKENSFKFRIPLEELADDKFLPDLKENIEPENNSTAQEQYRNLFYKFYEELKGLKQFKDNVELWFAQFDNLYMRYAGQIPAATISNSMKDISLYDHSKITAAIATALYLYHEQNGETDVESYKKIINEFKKKEELENKGNPEKKSSEDEKCRFKKFVFSRLNQINEKKFLFVGTSFFGIQKFIFSSGAQTNKNAAKILRGRSFYVSLFSEAIADMLLKETGLPVTSIIFNAAGQVTLLAPNLQYIKEAVDRVKKQANEWLLKRFYGQTSLGLAYTEVSQEEIGFKYREIWNNFSIEMEEQKYTKFDLSKFGGAQKQFFAEYNNEYGVCRFCGKRPAIMYSDSENSIPVCGVCQDQITMGAKLVKADAIALWKDGEADFKEKLCEPLFGQYHVWLGKLGEAVNNANSSNVRLLARLSNSINDIEWRKVAYRPLKAYVPFVEDKEDRSVKSFEDLAECAVKEDLKTGDRIGVKAIGVLKADVDNLGKIFSLGLNNSIQTLTRTSVLSRQLNNFFAVYLPHLFETEYPEIYTVFAGGDDLFLIGPHDQILDIAPRIREEFRKFVCNNSEVTLSMGISVHKPGEPVAIMANAAEEALEEAKTNAGKDSICVFGEVVKWDKYKELLLIKSELKKWCDIGAVNTSILYRFNKAIEDMMDARRLTESVMKNKKISIAELSHALSWKGRLKYSLIRTINNYHGKSSDFDIFELEKIIPWLELYGSSIRIPLWSEIYRRRK